MRPVIAFALLSSFVAVAAGQPQPQARVQTEDADAKAIRQTALDYIEGWYEGDVERMTRAVSPELVKRIIVNERGASRIEGMGASKLIAGVRAGYGKDTPKARQQKEVTILDRYENASVVKIIATDWIDYLQIGKIDGRWVILNVLWERKPKS